MREKMHRRLRCDSKENRPSTFTVLAALILVFLLLLFIVYPNQRQYHDQPPSKRLLNKHFLRGPSSWTNSENLLSLIEFVNPPYLDFTSIPSSIVPIIVLSKAKNIDVRDAIRRTWGFEQSYRNGTIQMKIFFLVGTDDYMSERLRTEQLIFDDTIVVSLPDMDSYIAYKDLAAMIWVRTHLRETKFYLKSEEDVILNVKCLAEDLIPSIEPIAHRHLIFGWFGNEHVVARGTYQNFLNELFPSTSLASPYAMCLFYGITSSAADRMLDAISHLDQIDQPGDQFVTGLLRDAADVQMHHLSNFTTGFRYDLANGLCKEAFAKNSKLLLCTSSLHQGNLRSIHEYFDVWNSLI